VTALLAALVLPATGASAAAPPPVAPGPDIEAFAPFQGQTACEAVARPGVTAFRDLVIAAYPATRNGGIVRTCSVRGASEHKEGRAWDWMVNAANPSDAAAVQDLLDWLMATDEYGNSAAMARRLGVMYVIWNSQIWKSYQADRGWQPYRGASAHTDHVHISFSWAGALRLTSYWTGQVSPTVQSPIVVATPSPTASAGTSLPPDTALGDPLLTAPGAGTSASPPASPPASPSASPPASPPAARRTTAKPVVKRSTAKPVAKRSTAKPVAKRSTAKPVAKRSTAKPVAKRSTAKPVAKRSTAKPVAKRSTAKPVAKRSTAKPVAKRSTAKPVAKRSTAKPVAKRSTAKPVAKRSTAKPVAKRSTAKPSATRSATPRPSATRSPSSTAPAARSATSRPSVARSAKANANANANAKAKNKAKATTTTSRSATPRPSVTRPAPRKASVTRSTDRRRLTGPWRRH